MELVPQILGLQVTLGGEEFLAVAGDLGLGRRLLRQEHVRGFPVRFRAALGDAGGFPVDFRFGAGGRLAVRALLHVHLDVVVVVEGLLQAWGAQAG